MTALASFPLLTNVIVMMTSPVLIPVFLNKEEHVEFLESEIEAIKNLEGVMAAYRRSTSWMEEGRMEGVEFEAIDREYRSVWGIGLPLLREGRYPSDDEPYAVVLGDNTAQRLGLETGSEISLLGERFTVVGVTMWSSEFFGVWMPYETLVELRGNYSLETYDAFPGQFSPSDFRESLTVLLDSYDHVFSFIEMVPSIADVVDIYPDAESLRRRMTESHYEGLLKLVYSVCFATLGAIGFSKILKYGSFKRDAKRIRFWLTLVTLSLSLVLLYFSSFASSWVLRGYSAGQWLGTILLLALEFTITGPLIPAMSTFFAVRSVLSLWRRRIFHGAVNGLTSVIGWILTIRFSYTIIPASILNFLVAHTLPVFPYNITSLLLYVFPLTSTIAVIPDFVFLPRQRIFGKIKALSHIAKLLVLRI